MKKVASNDITALQMMSILVGVSTGVGVLSLPNDMVKVSMQDGWISAILGGVYPLYMISMCMLLFKNHPNEDILQLSKKYMGIILGNILNIIFISYFLFIATAIISGLKNILYTFIIAFSMPSKIIFVITAVALLTASKELKVLGRINEIFLFLTLLFISASLAVFPKGTIINIMPVGGSGIKNIIFASKGALFTYSGIEILFLIYPYVTDKGNIKRAAYGGVIILIAMYSWVVFSAIYLMGIDIIPRSIWSFFKSITSFRISIINNFRFIFMILWSMIIFKTAAGNLYAVVYGINYFLNFKRLKNICIFLFPPVFILSYLYKNEVFRRNVLDFITPKYIIFNVIYITLITTVSCFGRGKKNEAE